MSSRQATSALTSAAISGLIAFVLVVAGAVVLLTDANLTLGWSLLAFGLASVVATAMFTLAATRPPNPR